MTHSKLVFCSIIAGLAIEFFLRFAFGLGSPPLYVYDDSVEYYLKPDQEIFRFGRAFKTNSFGMRSSNINEQEDEVILLVGDSVVNGGVLLDQSEIISTRLERDLQARLRKKDLKVASISAGSWGPRNQIAFLLKMPDFKVSAIIHIFSSHDDGDVPTFRYRAELYPQDNPSSALGEVVVKYLPRVVSFVNKALFGVGRGEDTQEAGLSGELEYLFTYLSTYQVPVLRYHHRTRAEVMGESDSYACEDIAECRVFEFQKRGTTDLDSFYIDNIHPSSNGARSIADRVATDLEAVL